MNTLVEASTGPSVHTSSLSCEVSASAREHDGAGTWGSCNQGGRGGHENGCETTMTTLHAVKRLLCTVRVQ